jgi:para-aminobenzoate synthetase component I
MLFYFVLMIIKKNSIEDLISKKPSPLGFPDIISFKPEKKFEILDLTKWIVPSKNSPSVQLTARTSGEEYVSTVKKLKEHIQKGDIYEINYCITFEAFDVVIDPVDIYSRLNAISKAPYSALVKLDDKYIISASPELFLRKRGNKLITKPIKGTTKRGHTGIDDANYKNDLLNNLKERTENVMIVDVARNDLSRIAKKASVKVEKLYDIETFEQVHQMVSTISCELKDNVSLKDILHATFPMASMTGAPKIRAMQLIDEYEEYSRGPYSGCMGYIDGNGDFDLSVLIRSIFYNSSEKYLSYSVGSAITSLCDPEKEYEECLLKAAAMKKVLEGSIE